MNDTWRRPARCWSALAMTVVLAAGCDSGDSDPVASATQSPSTDPAPTGSPATTGYVDRVNDLCRDLLAEVLTVDIGNAVTAEQFLAKHEPLVAAISDFDAEVDAIPVAASEQPAADAFDAYRRFSDAADAPVAAAAASGDQEAFEAANIAFLETLGSAPPEIEAMHAAGIQCNAR